MPDWDNIRKEGSTLAHDFTRHQFTMERKGWQKYSQPQAWKCVLGTLHTVVGQKQSGCQSLGQMMIENRLVSAGLSWSLSTGSLTLQWSNSSSSLRNCRTVSQWSEWMCTRPESFQLITTLFYPDCIHPLKYIKDQARFYEWEEPHSHWVKGVPTRLGGRKESHS